MLFFTFETTKSILNENPKYLSSIRVCGSEPNFKVTKLFPSPMTYNYTRLECLQLASMSGVVQCLEMCKVQHYYCMVNYGAPLR
jgi:hypothetical protein